MKLAKFFLAPGVFVMLAFSPQWALAQTNFWQQTSGLYGGTISALAINNVSGHIFAATVGGGIFRSTNNGDSWTAVNSGLTNTTVFALAINARGHIFAGTTFTGGVFRSTNNGDSWTQVNSGLTSTVVYALAINANGYIFAGTYHGRVFRSAQTTTAVREKEIANAIPSSFELAQNHPNPFSANGTFGNPSTTIKYDLPQQVEVKLEIFDLTGRHVRTLAHQSQPAGRYAITWDGRNEQGEVIASGVYLYQLRAGTFTLTRRMALVQ